MLKEDVFKIAREACAESPCWLRVSTEYSGKFIKLQVVHHAPHKSIQDSITMSIDPAWEREFIVKSITSTVDRLIKYIGNK